MYFLRVYKFEKKKKTKNCWDADLNVPKPNFKRIREKFENNRSPELTAVYNNILPGSKILEKKFTVVKATLQIICVPKLEFYTNHAVAK